MGNSEDTKHRILQESARLFNVKGYKATSIRDITNVVGFTKGAIYRHFQDKGDLEEKTFVHLSKLVLDRFVKVVKSENNAPDKLRAICSFFENYIENPIIEGGCPVLNAAIESDDTMPGLKSKVVYLIDALQEALESIMKKGIRYGQIKPETDITYYSSIFIATLEGGIMMSKLRGNTKDIKMGIKHLHSIIETIKK